ncbi:MAG: hypothetical protein JW982_15215 [Spirochaetes bacterium]|nr:hypothetical protein [Spirochaetota bacterium]
MFSTSMNIDGTILNSINDISKNYGISKSGLIKELLERVCMNYTECIAASGLTSYQRLGKDRNWKCFRIDLTEKDCLRFFKIRFKYRVSVSKLLLIGFVLFLDEVLEKLKKNCVIKSKISNSYTSIRKYFRIFIQKEVNLLTKTKNKQTKT